MSAPLAPWRAAVVAEARAWIGTPFLHQGSLRGIGCDCLGLARGVWRSLLGEEPEAIPPYGLDWAQGADGEPLAQAAARHCAPVPLDALAPGDLLLFRWRAHLPAMHIGIATPGGAMVHAHDGACVAEVHAAIWRRRLAYAFAFPEPAPRAAKA